MSEIETDPRDRTTERAPTAMTVYEVINPSDAVTFEADDPRIAILAGAFVGDGRYGVRDDKGNDPGLPLFLFGGCGDWLESEGLLAFARTPEGGAKLAAALDSFVCCSIANRKAIRAAVGNDPEAMARFNEEKRTSMNNICGRARKIAATLRKAEGVAGGR